MNHEDYMRIALEEAVRGMGWTNPNPMVGAVIVKDGRIIGKGYHHRCGELHAERNAIADCREDMKGAAIYVTLEPCCHYGKTPPCTEAIIEQGITTVVIGSDDPNPLVAGKGIESLRAHGITVITGVLKEECDALNQIFFPLHQNGASLCCHEICYDSRWENSNSYSCFQVDYRRAGEIPCAAVPPSLCGNYGRCGYGPVR